MPSKLEEEHTQDESDDEFQQNDEEGTPGENHPNESPPTKRAKTNAKAKTNRTALQWKKMTYTVKNEGNFTTFGVNLFYLSW